MTPKGFRDPLALSCSGSERIKSIWTYLEVGAAECDFKIASELSEQIFAGISKSLFGTFVELGAVQIKPFPHHTCCRSRLRSFGGASGPWSS